MVDNAVNGHGGATGSRINSRYWLNPKTPILQNMDIRLFRVSRVSVIPGAWVTSSLS